MSPPPQKLRMPVNRIPLPRNPNLNPNLNPNRSLNRSLNRRRPFRRTGPIPPP